MLFKKYISFSVFTFTIILTACIFKPSYAQSIIPDGNTTTTINISGNGDINITSRTIENTSAFNSFSRFSINQGETVNLNVPDQANFLINIVTDQATNIEGILNSIKKGEIGGSVYFVNPFGFIVGTQGTINAGSLTVLTPPKSFTDNFFTAPGNPDDTSTFDLLIGRVQANPNLTVINQGNINTLNGFNITTGTFTNTGIVEIGDIINTGNNTNANKITNISGQVSIIAEKNFVNTGRVEITGNPNMEGGTINILAKEQILLDANSKLIAQGNGNAAKGGIIIASADQAFNFNNGAIIDVRGGNNTTPQNTAEGGFIDLHSNNEINLKGDLKALNPLNKPDAITVNSPSINIFEDTFTNDSPNNTIFSTIPVIIKTPPPVNPPVTPPITPPTNPSIPQNPQVNTTTGNKNASTTQTNNKQPNKNDYENDKIIVTEVGSTLLILDSDINNPSTSNDPKKLITLPKGNFAKGDTKEYKFILTPTNQDIVGTPQELNIFENKAEINRIEVEMAKTKLRYLGYDLERETRKLDNLTNSVNESKEAINNQKANIEKIKKTINNTKTELKGLKADYKISNELHQEASHQFEIGNGFYLDTSSIKLTPKKFEYTYNNNDGFLDVMSKNLDSATYKLNKAENELETKRLEFAKEKKKLDSAGGNTETQQNTVSKIAGDLIKARKNYDKTKDEHTKIEKEYLKEYNAHKKQKNELTDGFYLDTSSKKQTENEPEYTSNPYDYIEVMSKNLESDAYKLSIAENELRIKRLEFAREKKKLNSAGGNSETQQNIVNAMAKDLLKTRKNYDQLNDKYAKTEKDYQNMLKEYNATKKSSPQNKLDPEIKLEIDPTTGWLIIKTITIKP